MPWCDTCSEYRTPNSLAEHGQCEQCGNDVAATAEDSSSARSVGQSAPWHFWLVVVALGIYLLWRLIDGITLLVT